MTRTKKLRLASTLTYLGHFLLVFVLSLVSFISGTTAETEGWEALGAAILIVLSILGFIYAAVLLLPLLLSFLSLRWETRGLTVACIPFDALYILLHLIYLISLIVGGESAALALLPTLALSCAPLVLNILTLKTKTAPQQAEATTEGEQL